METMQTQKEQMEVAQMRFGVIAPLVQGTYMERMEGELAALKQTQEAEESVQGGSKRKADQAVAFLEEDELTEDMKEKLIEKVIVYPGNRIEIVWRFKEHLEN